MFPSNFKLGNDLTVKHERTQTKILHNGIVIAVVPNARRRGVRRFPTFHALPEFVQRCAESLIDNARVLD